MLSKAMIIGNFGKDPEIRTTNSGKKVCSFSVAAETGYGEKKETQWHKVITFDEKLIENVIEKYVKKGTKVYLDGDLKYRTWNKEDGTTVYVTEIIMGFGSSFKLLGNKSDKGAKPEASESSGAPANDAFDLTDEVPEFN